MGYQQKSYKKFVATAATATLVASAIVPVASAAGFSDVSADSEFAPFIESLTDQGIINGYASDNTFRPNNKLTRGQVAIMLGRWLENNGETVPADWNKVSRFNDIPVNATSASGQELAKYAALVKDSGVFTGVLGNLNPTQNITRENMAVVLDRVSTVVAGVSLVELADDIEDVEVKDLATAQTAYQDEIQALADLGITTVSNFRPKEQVSRAQFAKFLYTTFEIIEEVTAAPTAEELQAEVSSIVETLPALSTITADNAATAKTTAAKATTELTTIETVIAEGEYTEEEVKELNKAIADAKTAVAAVVAKADQVIEAAKELAVESVSALNTHQFKVAFTQKVARTSAETVSNYKINGVALSSSSAHAVLLEDEKTVVVTLDTPYNQNTERTLVIEDYTISEKNTGKYAPKYTGTLTFADTAAPTVSNVKVNGNRQIVINFSEGVTRTAAINALNYQINGQSLASLGGTTPVATQFAQDNSVTNQVTINFDADLPAGNHTLTVGATTANPLKDKANYVLAKADTSFTVESVTTAPQVASIEASANGDVKVVFDRAIKASSLSNAFKVNNSGTITGTLDADDTTNKTVIFNSASVSEGANVLALVKNTVEDVYGNKFNKTEETRLSFTAAKDTVKPVVTAAYATSETEILVKLSEPVQATYLVNANFQLKDAQGNVVVGSTSNPWNTVVGANGNREVKLTLTATQAAKLGKENYTLEVKNLVDSSNNVMEASTHGVTTIDKTNPTLAASNNLTVNTTNRTLTVYFNEPMDVETIGNKANFLLAANGSTYEALPTDASISVAANGKSATITLPDTVNVSSFAGTAKVRAVNVKDKAGLTVQGAVAETGVAVAANVVNNPGIESATVTGTDSEVKVTFTTDQVLDVVDKAAFFAIETDATGNIAITDSNDAVGGTSTNLGNPTSVTRAGNSVTLTFTGAAATAIKEAGSEVTFPLNQTYAGNVNTDGAALISKTSGTATKAKDQVAPELVQTAGSVAVATANTIELTFNEAISGGNLDELKDDFVITTGGALATVTGVTVSGDTVTVTTRETLADTVTVRLVQNNVSIKDVSNNVYVPTNADLQLWTASIATATTATAVATNVATAATAVGTGTLTVTVDGTDYDLVLDGTTVSTFADVQAIADAIETASNGSVALDTVADVTVGTGADAGKIFITTKSANGTASTVAVTATGTDSAAVLTLTGFAGTETAAGTNAATSGNFSR